MDKYSYLGMAVSIRVLELQKIPKYSCLSMPIAGEHQSIHIQGALCALCSLVIMVYKLWKVLLYEKLKFLLYPPSLHKVGRGAIRNSGRIQIGRLAKALQYTGGSWGGE